MATKFFVIDLNTTEACDTLDEAKAKAEWWIQIERANLADRDDDDIADMLHGGAALDGMDNGDVEIYECDADDEDIRDYDGRISGRKIRENYEAIEIYDGFATVEAEAEARGIE